MSPEFVLQLIIALGTIGGGSVAVYLALRADITRALITAEQAAKNAARAHARIDKIFIHEGVKQ